jgi:hypothetical protein
VTKPSNGNVLATTRVSVADIDDAVAVAMAFPGWGGATLRSERSEA